MIPLSPYSSRPIQVGFDLPSGSKVNITLYNRDDARYIFEAVKEYAAKHKKSPPHLVASPRMVE